MYQAYKSKGEQKFQKTEWWGANSEKLGIHFKHVNIKFLGVWDTVGALGLPDSFISRALNNSKGYEFHDTELSDGRFLSNPYSLPIRTYSNSRHSKSRPSTRFGRISWDLLTHFMVSPRDSAHDFRVDSMLVSWLSCTHWWWYC